ncbi:glycosyltransferase [Pantoea dispersa]|uniref:glycosyltransferase family 2 protein n=1 Tax=Pantoea dispersa TaxID=59814 RepID=UPI0021AEFA47|nr:glycosyltransferase family 2 protein [Pantoea dispersa]MCT6588733.1 glycosyltransferase [Pantoea dispersa]
MTPKISIIITSYNIENYISECLDNIIDQTIKDIEIIVVDDGSKDKTPEIIMEYSKRDPRIVPILNQQNSIGGVATPANIGINKAQGQYIGFADGDDLYDINMFEKLFLAAEKHSADVVLCAYEEFEGDATNTNPPYEPAWSNFVGVESLEIVNSKDKKRVLDLLPVPWRKLYKSELLKEKNILFPVGPYFFEDNGFHWFTTLQANKVAFVDEILCLHRRNRVGQTMSSGGHKLLGVFHQHEVIFDYLSKNNLFDEYRDYSLNWLCGHLSWIQQVLSPEYAKDFYDTLIPHYDKYSKKEVQNYLAGKFYDRKSLELIVAVIRKNRNTFVKAMTGKVSSSINEKIIFNFNKLGPKKFAAMIFRIAKHHISSRKESINRNKPRKQSLQELSSEINVIRHDIELIKAKLVNIEASNSNLSSEINHGVLLLGKKLSDIERVVETGFILAESKK